jgi:hypothetical protein
MARTEALTQLEEVHMEPLTGALNGGDEAREDRTGSFGEAGAAGERRWAAWFRPTAFRSLYAGMVRTLPLGL